MMESLLQNLDTVLVYIFGVAALVAGALMIVLRHPMQVAMALISAMGFLGGVYGLLGVHFIAAGHYATETLGIRRLGELAAERFGVRHEFVDVPNPI